MSQKLPVAETALAAMAFGGRMIFPVLKVAGAPLLLALCLAAWALWPMVEGGQARPLFGISGGMPLRIAAFTFAFFLTLPIAVRVLAVAADADTLPGGGFYWRFGGTELRFLAMLILTFVLILGLLTGVNLALLSLGAKVAASGDLTLGWVPALFRFVGVVFAFWLSLRFVLAGPSAAIDNSVNVVAAFRATGGNVFRLIGSLGVLGLLIAALIVSLVLIQFILGLFSGQMMLILGDATLSGRIVGGSLAALSLLLTVGGWLWIKLAVAGWFGVAWATLRPASVSEGVQSGPGGEVFAV
ncbi:hypothetical protein PB2503_08329 [Parvularcula bermudensis HTCC2503]|uniref:Uncharacterized protein n=1 Tax=Parvularcula bermudensis (strain ATCC BAA-594 / HTCC2503 / KCTC 12087) TaxID=314260 RepID=E0TID7_PARBH|nr:hypothetical protein [Parvularcula bermudensis]ADM09721.1 hypothetical protein PB2503_08329 [Parvularcula bermudensis HTCC2503]